jgi:small-conductance mechanosensitive channel
MVLDNIITFLDGSFPIIETVCIVILLILIFNFAIGLLKRKLLKKAKTKSQVSYIKILARIFNVGFIALVILFAFLRDAGSWAGFSVVLGLLTAALGFALQKPITGIAAWIMVILKRPFRVGDRISIGNVKGDVYDMSLSHVYIDEAGGLIDGEQHSGRNVMVPNYLLFEQSIINYTLLDDYIIREVDVTITYGSNLDKAMEIVEKVTAKHAGGHTKNAKREIQVSLSLKDNGARIHSRFFAPVRTAHQTVTDITKDIYDSFKKQKDIKFSHL